MDASQRLKGRVAVVTGGAQGIGFGIAARLAEEGAILVIADINESKPRHAAQRIAERGGTVASASIEPAKQPENVKWIDPVHQR